MIYFTSPDTSSIGDWSESDKEALINDLEVAIDLEPNDPLYSYKSELIECCILKFENSYSSYEAANSDINSETAEDIGESCAQEILSDFN